MSDVTELETENPAVETEASNAPVPSELGYDLAELERIRNEIKAWEDDRTLSPLSKDNVQYLIDQCPFLQIVNSDYATYGEVDFKIVRLKSGWDLHHYGDAMSASPGRLLFGLGARHGEEGDDDEGSGGLGTIIKQAVDTATQMVDLAVEKNWGGVMIVDGHPLMQWAAWMKCLELNFPLHGYSPTDDSYARVKHAHISVEEIDRIKQSLRKS